jgi:hypothetical protein
VSSLAYDILPLNRKEILNVVQDLAADEGYLQKEWMDGAHVRAAEETGR